MVTKLESKSKEKKRVEAVLHKIKQLSDRVNQCREEIQKINEKYGPAYGQGYPKKVEDKVLCVSGDYCPYMYRGLYYYCGSDGMTEGGKMCRYAKIKVNGFWVYAT